MKRLLCIVGVMNAGGAETFLMKVYRSLDRTKYQMDFAVAVDEPGLYDEEIISLGGKIYHIPPKSEGVIKNFREIKKLVKKEQYKYVLRTSQHSLSALELLASKHGGAKVRVFRSSNSNTTTGVGLDLLLHKLCRFMPNLFANVRIAPSTEAAEFMFGRGSVKSGKAFILHNGIALDFFKFDKTARDECRRELGISDDFVVGHIGRFNHQKNHKKLLEIFKQMVALTDNAKLLLVGKGELEEDIKSYANRLGLTDRVIFTGVRTDVSRLLCAMDVYVFPSLFEGMPNTVVEAQATGLPCIISDTITKEAKVTDLVEYFSLNSDPKEWAARIIEKISECNNRLIAGKKLYEAGYDINEVVNSFVRLVFGGE